VPETAQLGIGNFIDVGERAPPKQMCRCMQKNEHYNENNKQPMDCEAWLPYSRQLRVGCLGGGGFGQQRKLD